MKKMLKKPVGNTEFMEEDKEEERVITGDGNTFCSCINVPRSFYS